MMSTVTPQIGFYYVNGIANTDESGSEVTTAIQKIIQKASNYAPNNTFVTFHHNNSAPIERVIQDVALTVLGMSSSIYSIIQEARDKGTLTSRCVGFAGICAIVVAACDYKQMQEDKNAVAIDLASRVSKFLNENQSNIANFVLHSQGADVGYRSLELLSEYKERIGVITLGPMITIPGDMCAQVHNYQLENDWVSKILASPFEEKVKSLDGMGQRSITSLENEGLIAHNVREYLKDESVQRGLSSLLIRCLPIDS